METPQGASDAAGGGNVRNERRNRRRKPDALRLRSAAASRHYPQYRAKPLPRIVIDDPAPAKPVDCRNPRRVEVDNCFFPTYSF
jgi:hypothetical protein